MFPYPNLWSALESDTPIWSHVYLSVIPSGLTFLFAYIHICKYSNIFLEKTRKNSLNKYLLAIFKLSSPMLLSLLLKHNCNYYYSFKNFFYIFEIKMWLYHFLITLFLSTLHTCSSLLISLKFMVLTPF